jgi:uncharacterized protein (TIGR03546 family)
MKKKIRYIYDRFINLNGEPEAIAMGMAIGVFVGVTPTIPFHTVLLVFVTLILRQNVTAAYLGSWIISNPFTIPLFYFVQYQIGYHLLGFSPYQITFSDLDIIKIISFGWNIAIPLFLGGIIMAPFFAIPAYFITRCAVLRLRKKAADGDNPEKNS